MRAPDRVVFWSDGVKTPLAAAYVERPLALVFLRHFGCVFCRRMVAQLRPYGDWNVAFVAMATPAEAEAFRRKTRSPHRFVCDPRAELYDHFGLGRGKPRQMFSPKVIAAGVLATLEGHTVGRPIGDPWRMPGAFVLSSPDGEVVWAHRSRDAADNPLVSEIGRELAAAASTSPSPPPYR